MDLHHIHIFASDINRTLRWWKENLGARILYDGELAGSRNVLIGVGAGRVNVYDQPPTELSKSTVHHVGVRVENLRNQWMKLQKKGVSSPNGMREYGNWRYVMIAAPDNLLVELFEFDESTSPFNLDG